MAGFANEEFRRAAGAAAQRYVCQLSPFVGAIGIRALTAGNVGLGAVLLPAGLLAQGLCPPDPNQAPAPPGWGIPVLRGQCAAFYNIEAGWRFYQSSSGQQGPLDVARFDVFGPIRVTESSFRYGLQTTANAGRFTVQAGAGFNTIEGIDGFGIVPGTFYYRVIPKPGNPDNCGNQPPIYYPDPQPPVLPPVPPTDPDGNPVFEPDNQPEPYQPNPDKPPIFLPIVFPPIVLKPDISFPITVPINVGGIKAGDLVIKFDGTFELNFGQSTGGASEDYGDLLEEIKACVCPKPPPVEPVYDTVSIPYLDTTDSEESCRQLTFTLLVAPGALTTDKADKLAATATAAVSGCESKNPVQKSEVLIGTGTVPSNPVEQFTPPIPPEVVSVRIRILNIPASAPKIGTFPAANQYKFGSAAFSLLPARAGGDYVYLFDQDTYLPLPQRGKDGVIRLLLRGGTQWEVYDTGERL